MDMTPEQTLRALALQEANKGTRYIEDPAKDAAEIVRAAEKYYKFLSKVTAK